MAKLYVVGSSSKGNAYALEAGDEILLLEAGCKFMSVKRMIGFRVNKIVGCLISHEHSDHAGYGKEYLNQGFSVIAPMSTAVKLGDEFGTILHVPVELTPQTPGKFRVVAFDLPHNGVKNYGYLIEHDEFGKLLFMTDFEYCKYNFKNQKINHMLVEANYSKEIIDRWNANREHVILGHAEIGTTCDFITANATEELQSVTLLHLSDGNSDEVEFIRRAQDAAGPGVDVRVADPGLSIGLIKQPF